MNDLIKLAERCEAATGPDRELDLLLWRVADPVNASHVLDNGKAPLPWLHRYTASLDAAVTLVPEGWSAMAFERFEDKCFIELEEVVAQGATPALALCAAALRARAAIAQTPGQPSAATNNKDQSE